MPRGKRFRNWDSFSRRLSQKMARIVADPGLDHKKIIDHFNTENRSEVLHCLRQLADLNKIQIDATGQRISKLR